ncbi:MAG: glycine betaine/L-proline ABC transporter permease ProW [Polaromonas sp.]
MPSTNIAGTLPTGAHQTSVIAQASASPSPWDTAVQTTQAAAPASSPDAIPPITNPWLTATDPTGGSAGDTAAAASNWLDAPVAAMPVDSGWHIQQLWDGSLPVQSWINSGLDWIVLHFRPFFQTVRVPIDSTLSWVEALLQNVPSVAMIVLFGLLAWQFAGRMVAIGTAISLLIVVMLGIWPEAMVTLSLVLTSLVFCLVLGLPLGILLASSERAERIMRPILDAMQTTPAFVYLVPVVMLFGIGNVPGVIVTIIFALAPLVRLTNLGIRQVRPDLIEAARAYGASPWQMLTKLQLPLAMPSIMAGVNQALMLSLSMVVIASMIAVGGLGQMVLRGIGRLDMGLATVGGLGIVLLAISLDRITQAMGQPTRGARHWWHTGPTGVLWRLLHRSDKPSANAEPAPAPNMTPTVP